MHLLQEHDSRRGKVIQHDRNEHICHTCTTIIFENGSSL